MTFPFMNSPLEKRSKNQELIRIMKKRVIKKKAFSNNYVNIGDFKTLHLQHSHSEILKGLKEQIYPT